MKEYNYTGIFVIALVIIAKNFYEAQYPSIYECINPLWFIYALKNQTNFCNSRKEVCYTRQSDVSIMYWVVSFLRNSKTSKANLVMVIEVRKDIFMYKADEFS